MKICLYFNVLQGHRQAFDIGPSQNQDVCIGFNASILALMADPTSLQSHPPLDTKRAKVSIVGSGNSWRIPENT